MGRYASQFYSTETADSRHVFVTSLRDNRTWELDPEPLSVVRSWPVGDYAGAVSPDGRIFALGSESGAVRLLDLGSGRIRPLRGGHDGRMFRMRFTPDGRTLVTTGERWTGARVGRRARHRRPAVRRTQPVRSTGST